MDQRPGSDQNPRHARNGGAGSLIKAEAICDDASARAEGLSPDGISLDRITGALVQLGRAR